MSDASEPRDPRAVAGARVHSCPRGHIYTIAAVSDDGVAVQIDGLNGWWLAKHLQYVESEPDPCTSFPAYNEWRRTKCPPGLSPRDNLINAALGLVGEAGELAARLTDGAYVPGQIEDEAGDVIFYSVWLADAAGVDPSIFGVSGPDRYADWRHAEGRILSGACRCAEAVKKHLYHGKADALNHLAVYLVDTAGAVDEVLPACGSSLEKAMRRNVEKLNRRYPDGFASGGGIRAGSTDEKGAAGA